LHNRIPVDDEDFQAEMDRIAAEGGDPFFLTPENWEGTNGNIEEEDEQTGTSMKLVTFSETENEDSETFSYATDGKGPSPRLSSPKADAWKTWDGTVDEDAHMD
jgi:hypothetical protein